MSNCHNHFLKFADTITLSKAEMDKLKTSRDAIQGRIKSHFKLKGYQIPEFKGQGSFTMGTSIRPVSGYYDLDLGIYLKGLGTDPDNWPKTESIHNLVYNSVLGHTTLQPIRKSCCIRVQYRPPYASTKEISYHIDLPIYAYKETFWGDLKTVIAMKGDKQWSERSDTQKFSKWFLDQCAINNQDKEQLKRIVKYLKAWKENAPTYPKLPSGMILTVLAAKNFKPHYRDDIAFVQTVKEFHYLLDWSFSIKKPTEPFNNLAELLSDTEEENFMNRLETLLDISERAIDAGDAKALQHWKRVFGSRFLDNAKPTLIS